MEIKLQKKFLLEQDEETLDKCIFKYILMADKVKYGFFAGKSSRKLREINELIEYYKKYPGLPELKRAAQQIILISENMGNNHPVLLQARKLQKIAFLITNDITNFMRTFKSCRVVAMYEPCDTYMGKRNNENDKYRIQVHFRPSQNEYSKEDEKKILKFFEKYINMGYLVFSAFEKEFIRLICSKLKGKSYINFMQIDNDEENYRSFLESEAREGRTEISKMKEIWNCSYKEETRNGELITFEKFIEKKMLRRKFITLNRPIYGKDKFWNIFFESLEKGYGTIGFDDYIGGITIRGGMTTVSNNNHSFSYARNQEFRYKEKKERLKSLLSDIEANYDMKNDNEQNNTIKMIDTDFFNNFPDDFDDDDLSDTDENKNSNCKIF